MDWVDKISQFWPHFTEHLKLLARVVSRLVAEPLTAGNRVQPLVNDYEAFPAMLAAIESAQESISLVSYIFDNDASGRAFADALGRAAKRGVAVRVLIDVAGTRYSWPPITYRLKRVGVRCAKFLPAALAEAQTSVQILTPSFLPDPALITTLNLAALRGVRVDITMPSKNNLPFVHWASRAMWWQLLQRGCHIWLTPPPFDHSKLTLGPAANTAICAGAPSCALCARLCVCASPWTGLGCAGAPGNDRVRAMACSSWRPVGPCPCHRAASLPGRFP
jgi:phosphatidylserine/phosphatidylglycerophosphate/cardiolipin synthase-like enzyme